MANQCWLWLEGFMSIIEKRSVRVTLNGLPAMLLIAAWQANTSDTFAEAWLVFPDPKGDSTRTVSRYIAVPRLVDEKQLRDVVATAMDMHIGELRTRESDKWGTERVTYEELDDDAIRVLRSLAPYPGIKDVGNSHCGALFEAVNKMPKGHYGMTNDLTVYPQKPKA
jgi:hypothetical protein